MKLDESVVKDIMRTVVKVYKDEMSSVDLWEYLHDLDLVIEGSSQSKLVLLSDVVDRHHKNEHDA
jgi:hypothetical protein